MAVVMTLLAIALVFIPLGIVCLVASNDVVEVVDRYDDCAAGNNNTERMKTLENANGNGGMYLDRSTTTRRPG